MYKQTSSDKQEAHGPHEFLENQFIHVPTLWFKKRKFKLNIKISPFYEKNGTHLLLGFVKFWFPGLLLYVHKKYHIAIRFCRPSIFANIIGLRF